VEDKVRSGDDHASRLGHVVKVEGASVNLPGGETEKNLYFDTTFTVRKIILVDAMSGGEDDIVRDQRATAESSAIDEQPNLVFELAAGCIFAADDPFSLRGEVS
jgi:hypothetical protein